MNGSLSHRGLKPLADLAAKKPHGDRLRYMAGCRCVPCRAANSRYECARLKARQSGEWNGLVSTKEVKRHLRKLSRAGIGYKTVADASGVAKSTLARIKSGKKRQIRKQTEARILAVTAQARADASIVPAGQTWKYIYKLLEEGFTKAEIARRLGKKTPALQIRKDYVLARTAVAIERLYNRIMN